MECLSENIQDIVRSMGLELKHKILAWDSTISRW